MSLYDSLCTSHGGSDSDVILLHKLFGATKGIIARIKDVETVSKQEVSSRHV